MLHAGRHGHAVCRECIEARGVAVAGERIARDGDLRIRLKVVEAQWEFRESRWRMVEAMGKPRAAIGVSTAPGQQNARSVEAMGAPRAAIGVSTAPGQ
jgi:hypothetical protein